MAIQHTLDGDKKEVKSYRAERHDVVRKKQSENSNEVHHPRKKKQQIKRVLEDRKKYKIVEYFAGEDGNLSPLYEKYGDLEKYDKKLGSGDSYKLFHKHIYEGKEFDVIDLDPYGFPNRMFPDIFRLIDKGYMFVTVPKPHVNMKNGIIQQHLKAYYGTDSFDYNELVDNLIQWGLCHWRKVDVVDAVEIDRLWRIALKVKRVKATHYTQTRNRAEMAENPDLDSNLEKHGLE